MGELWTPLPEGPHEAFVERLYRVISRFAEEHRVEKPLVEVELIDRRIELRRAPDDQVAGFGFSVPSA